MPPSNPMRYIRPADGPEHMLRTCLRCGCTWRETVPDPEDEGDEPAVDAAAVRFPWLIATLVAMPIGIGSALGYLVAVWTR
jgi:hypothetical protein